MLRHEQQTVRVVLAAVEHHSHGAPREQTTATRTEHFAQVIFPQERNSERIMEQAVDPHFPQDMKGPEIECVAPALAVSRRRRLAKRVAPAPATVYAAPDPVAENVAPSPAVTRAAPAPVTEYASTSPAAWPHHLLALVRHQLHRPNMWHLSLPLPARRRTSRG